MTSHQSPPWYANLQAYRVKTDYLIISSDLAVLPHPCLIFPSQIQHPLTRRRELAGIVLKNTQSGNSARAFFMLSHSYSALPYLCIFFLSPYLLSAGVLRWDCWEAELGAYTAGFLCSSAALWFCPSLRTHKWVIPCRETPQQSSEVRGRWMLCSRNSRNSDEIGGSLGSHGFPDFFFFTAFWGKDGDNKNLSTFPVKKWDVDIFPSHMFCLVFCLYLDKKKNKYHTINTMLEASIK